MHYKTAAFMFIALGAFAAAPTCNYDAMEEVTIVIYGQGDNYEGEYVLDTLVESVFSGTEMTSGVYKYSELVEVEETILVNIFPQPTSDTSDDEDETDLTDVTFRVLDEDGDIIYEDSSSVDSTLMRTFEFDFDSTVDDDNPYEDE